MANRNHCCCCLCRGCWFYSTTWRMISRCAGYKIHFRKQPPFRGNFFPCLCDIFRFFEFIILGNSSTAPVFSYNQINKQLKNLNVYIESVSAISHSSQSSRCFNNVILHLNEIIKNSVIIRNYSYRATPFIQRWGNLLCQSAWENHGNSLLTLSTETHVSTERKSQSRARVGGNRWNTDTLLLWTVFFAPGESS